jgi:hypothetical protein
MSKHLRVRILKRHKLPKNKFKYIIKLKDLHKTDNNREEFQPIIDLLTTNSIGEWQLQIHKRTRWRTPRKIKTIKGIYLSESMDVAIVKLAYSEYIVRIYQIEVEENQT